MFEEILTDIGLTKSEIAVYLSLLKIGTSSTGNIIKSSKIASGKAYLVLDRLIQKGLVTYSIKSNVKYYQAKNPERIVDYIDEKRNNLTDKKVSFEKILPKLKAEYEEKKYQNKGEIYEGVKGFKSFYELALKELSRGEYIYVMGVPKVANDKFKAFLLEWNKERIKKGVFMKILFNSDCRKEGRLREKMKLTEVRYMDPGLETPVWIDIFKENVVTINVHGDPICFVIKNKESSEAYMKYFGYIWNNSKN